MNQKTFLSLAGIIFLVIAVFHVLRIVLGWEAMIAGWAVPIWLSYVVVLVAGYLGYQGITLGKK